MCEREWRAGGRKDERIDNDNDAGLSRCHPPGPLAWMPSAEARKGRRATTNSRDTRDVTPGPTVLRLKAGWLLVASRRWQARIASPSAFLRHPPRPDGEEDGRAGTQAGRRRRSERRAGRGGERTL